MIVTESTRNAYDNADRLTAVTGPGAATFTYNPNGDQLIAGMDTFPYDNTAGGPCLPQLQA